MKILIGLMALVACVSSFAKEGGNGGDALVCKHRGTYMIESVELLDYYEGRVLRRIKPETLSATYSLEENMEILFRNFAKPSPNRVKLYRKWYKSFFEEANFIDDIVLVDIPDSAHLAFKAGCSVEQVIVQQPPRYPEDKRYSVSNDIWKLLDSRSQAGLIMHEMILREIMETKRVLKHEDVLDTLDVRYLNSLIAAGQLKDKSFEEFNKLLDSFDFFHYFEVDGFSELVASYGLTPDEGAIAVSHIWNSGPKYLSIEKKVKIRLADDSGGFVFWKKSESLELLVFDVSYKFEDGMHVLDGAKKAGSFRIKHLVINKSGIIELFTPDLQQGRFNLAEVLSTKDDYDCQNINFKDGRSTLTFDPDKSQLLSVDGRFESCGLSFESENVKQFDEEGIPQGIATAMFLNESGLRSVGVHGLVNSVYAKHKKIMGDLRFGERNFSLYASDRGPGYGYFTNTFLVPGSEVIMDPKGFSYRFQTELKVRVCDFPGNCNSGCKDYAENSSVSVSSNQQICKI